MNSNAEYARSAAAALAVFSAGYYATLLTLLARENPTLLVLAVAGYALMIIAIETLVVIAAGTLLGRKVAAISATAFAALNAYSLYLVHMGLGPAPVSGLAAGIAGCFALVLAATASRKAVRMVGMAALALIPLLSLIDRPGATGAFNDMTPENRNLLEDYASIRLHEKPNIYLISFDAMIPLPAARKMLNIDSLPYENKLRDLGATIVDHAFASNTPSVESFDALMFLDDHWHFKGEGYFAGRRPSPVSELFKANGYRVETGTSIPFYFGSIGPNVDEHVYVAKNFVEDSSLCKFATDKVRNYGVFRFCRFDSLFVTRYIFDQDVIEADPNAAYFDSDWHQQVLSRIAHGARDAPRLGIYYYYYPIGHAPNDFMSHDDAQLAQYRDRFSIQAAKAAEVIDELYAAIKRDDPGAIIMVFGDHGTKISRTVDWKVETEFFVQDNHIVLLSFLENGNACGRPDPRHAYAGDGYTTLGRAFASVIRCLSENPGKLDGLVRFIDKFKFSDFLIR